MHFGVGDLLEVSVYGVPELTTKARIGSSGDVYLPLIDYVHVEGLTPEEAQQLIEKRLADGGYVKNPHVQIFVAENASQSVTVLGEVARPGPYAMIGARRLYDVISAAGGLTDKAGRTVTIAHRTTPDKPITIQLAEGLAQTAESNVPVQPGDTIVIQRAGIVYAVGDVNRPSGFIIDNNNLTVLKLVALAGGTTRTAKLNGTKILRRTPTGIKETPIQLKKILHAKAPDVPLQADDILFVPGSATKAAAYRGSESVLQAATALSIIAVRP
jgi:polysaccharide export outer membrane protein